MSGKLQEAEAKLKELEKPRHDFENTRVAFIKAQQSGDEAAIKAAAAAHNDAIKARVAANVDPKAVDEAAQAVLDAREEETPNAGQ